MTSKNIAIHDVTGKVDMEYVGGDIEDKYHDKARAATYGKDKTPKYTIAKESGLLGRTSTMFSVEDGKEIAYWKHPALALKSAELTFPEGSPHASHSITMKTRHVSSMANEWVQDSVKYEWECPSQWKAGQYTLFRTAAGTRSVIGRYSQSMIKILAGGVLLVDTKEIDEVVAVLTMCVMLRRMLQRTAGRSITGNAGPVGWVGGAV